MSFDLNVLNDIQKDIESIVEEDANEILYEAQMNIHAIVDDARVEIRDKVLSSILHKYGLEMQKKFDSTCDIDDLIDTEIINTIHV